MNNNTISILVKAKDEASSSLKGVKSSLDSTSKAAEDSSRQLKVAGAAIAAVGVGITAFAKNSTDYTVQYLKGASQIARVTGESITESSRLSFALQQSGVSAEAAAGIFGIFSKQIVKARDDSAYASTALGQLNIAVKDGSGLARGFAPILLDVADKFKDMPDGALKSATAVQLFGRSGRDLIPILNKGSEGIKELEREADKLGLTLTNENIVGIKKYIQSQKDLANSTNALKVQVGTLTAPVLANFNTKVNEVLRTLLSSDGAVRDTTVAFLAFGGPVLTTSGAFIAFAANLRTAVAGMNIAAVASRALQIAIGPVGWALLAVGAALGGVLYLMGRHKEASDTSSVASQMQTTVEQRLSQAYDAQKAALDNVTQAQNALTDSRFSAEGSALAVERAQRSYNEAVKEYGPKSLEAREAAHHLESAKKDLATANEKVRIAQDNENLAEGRMANQTGTVVAALQARAGALQPIILKAYEVIGVIAQLDGRMLSVSGSVQGALNTIQRTARSTQGAINSIQVGGSGGGIQGGGTRLQGNASGTGYFGGGSTMVGEYGPEVVNLPRGSRIMPAWQTRAEGGGQAQATVIHENGTYHFHTGEAVYAHEQRRDQMQRLAAMGMA